MRGVQQAGLELTNDFRWVREHAPDTTITEKTKNDDATPHFRVVSIKDVGGNCS